ncbi:protein-L-isoaspartate O-methyltransferase 1-like isoform X2 [Olea europaea var. sylvestris]|uniref:protein-L-isoaspartate O-methyltransferase 1-like isoform X2 n=1 Tax=Olea europaea var. sylvestris TaxID=158386 RepID=UPI000C1D8414|nr:protein-L-isoaspartate O-methyltransferase 1-like isoform X2 [Olea europaea var. sylvestris]
MPSTYTHSLSVIAYGCRYRAPIKLSLSYFTPRHLHSHRRLTISQSPLVSALSATAFFLRSSLPNTHIFTGNSLFSRMERFWTGSGINTNKKMVEYLQSHGVIRSNKVAEVMETIDRALFVPEDAPPYMDSPVQIGYNATISAPHMHATCLELLENHLKPGMHSLDVGAGTGYLTACFAIMVGPQGRAVGVEHIPELVESSLQNIQKSAAASLLKEGSLVMHTGACKVRMFLRSTDMTVAVYSLLHISSPYGRLGWPEYAPYDAIHVGAAAPEIPQALIDQLKPGGRLVIPVGNIFQDLQVVDKNPDGSLSIRSETSVRYVPLTSRDAQLRG